MAGLLTKADLSAVTADLHAAIQRLETRIERETLRLTIRFGVMLAVAFGALAAILKLT
jgi:GTP cyclohydrolase III